MQGIASFFSSIRHAKGILHKLRERRSGDDKVDASFKQRYETIHSATEDRYVCTGLVVKVSASSHLASLKKKVWFYQGIGGITGGKDQTSSES